MFWSVRELPRQLWSKSEVFSGVPGHGNSRDGTGKAKSLISRNFPFFPISSRPTRLDVIPCIDYAPFHHFQVSKESKYSKASSFLRLVARKFNIREKGCKMGHDGKHSEWTGTGTGRPNKWAGREMSRKYENTSDPWLIAPIRPRPCKEDRSLRLRITPRDFVPSSDLIHRGEARMVPWIHTCDTPSCPVLYQSVITCRRDPQNRLTRLRPSVKHFHT